MGADKSCLFVSNQPDDNTDFCPGKQYGPTPYVQSLLGLADGALVQC